MAGQPGYRVVLFTEVIDPGLDEDDPEYYKLVKERVEYNVKTFTPPASPSERSAPPHAQSTTAFTRSILPILPGLMRKQSTPYSATFSAMR